MTDHITLNDDQQRIVTQLARAHGQTPEEWLENLINDAWESACAKYDAAFENDPDWQESAREAATWGDEPRGTVYSSTAEFLEALGATHEEVERARRLDASDEPLANSR